MEKNFHIPLTNISYIYILCIMTMKSTAAINDFTETFLKFPPTTLFDLFTCQILLV